MPLSFGRFGGHLWHVLASLPPSSRGVLPQLDEYLFVSKFPFLIILVIGD